MLTRSVVIAIAIVIVVLVLDQVSKAMVLGNQTFRALPCLVGQATCGRIEVSGIFDFTMVWNRGMSFGLFQSTGLQRWGLTIVQLAIAVGFSFWLARADRRITTISLALVIGGAIGNVIDRVRFGAVVDFFDFSGPWFGWQIDLPNALAFLEYPFVPPSLRDGVLGIGFPYVFNVADAAITVGAVLLFLDQFLLTREQSGTGKAG